MSMTWEQAYDLLGLEPPDEYALKAIERNFDKATEDRDIEEHPDSPLYREIGASTWLSVNAALWVLLGNNVGVKDENALLSLNLLGRTHKMVMALLKALDIKGVKVSPVDVTGKAGVFSVSSHLTNTVRGGYEVAENISVRRRWFYKRAWKERLIRRMGGPFEMIREIRLEDGTFQAYAEDDEYLMGLTLEGARQAIEKGARMVAWYSEATGGAS